MTTTQYLNTYAHIQIDGSDVSQALNHALASIEVDSSLYLPSMFVMRLNDPMLTLVDDASVAIGAAIKISMVDSDGTASPVFDGEITALEPEFTREGFSHTVVRGYDKAHRLQRVRATKTFVKMSDSDVASAIASASGLSGTCDSTTTVHDYVLQDNETNYEFLQRLAQRNGFVVMVKGTTLNFGKPPAQTGSPLSLKFGNDVIEFRPRMTAAAQFDSAKVYGWDVAQKQAIVGTASTPNSINSLGTDGHTSGSKFGATGDLAIVHAGVKDQGEANSVAMALLSRARTGDVTAEGLFVGHPALIPGAKVAISEVGTRFGGTYTVTRSIHRYDGTDGYVTTIEVSNGSGETAADLVGAGSHAGMRSVSERNVVVGVVTNNSDPEGSLGRVKVSFPWMPPNGSTPIESAWARLAAPMSGNSTGILFYPEVNDEVLVAFDHGDPTRPYIIGSLWNGQDATPIDQGTAVAEGKVVQRIIKTRAGHTILFDDSDSAAGIKIIDSKTKNTLTIDSVGGKFTIVADQEVDIKTTTPATEISMTGGKVTVKAQNISVEADAQLELKSNGTVKMTGQMVQIEGQGMTEIKGGVIKLN